MRDRIQHPLPLLGHRSLIEAGILHRDVSINNVMIAKNPRKNDPKGFLIDLDLAKLSDSTVRSGAPHRTGTMQFMAIEVLRRTAPHSWRHDLESFFYVLIWICVFHDGTGNVRKSRPNVLDGWSDRYAADIKYSQMATTQFETILDSFSEGFKSLKDMLKAWKKILFPLVDGGFFVGTFEDRDRVYHDLVTALKEKINQL